MPAVLGLNLPVQEGVWVMQDAHGHVVRVLWVGESANVEYRARPLAPAHDVEQVGQGFFAASSGLGLSLIHI